MSSGGFGSWLCKRWLDTYTSRLPGELAVQRRYEVASDLWEHQNDSAVVGRSAFRHNLDVIDRVLSGIPADLSWRRGIQRSHVRSNSGVPMKSHQTMPRSTIALIIVACIGIAIPLPFIALLGTGIESAEVLWVLGIFALAAVLAGGLVLRLRGGMPVVSTILLVVGSFAPSAAWFWLPPVYLLTIAIIGLALVTTRNQPVAPRQPMAPPAPV